MENPAQRLQRLLGVLEKWFSEACFLFKTEQFNAATHKQANCQAAINDIAVLLQNPEVRADLNAATEARFKKILTAYRQEAERIAAQKADLRSRLELLGATQFRAKNLRGAYVAPSRSFTTAFANQA